MKKFIQKRFKNERGLTLVELLAVVVILGIIAVISFVFVGGIIDNSKKDAHVANAQQLIAATKLYEASGGNLPTDGITGEKLQEEQLLDTLVDPWKKDEYSKNESKDTGTVTKDTVGEGVDKKDVYKITFNASDGKCNIIGATELDLSADGRDACGKNYETP